MFKKIQETITKREKKGNEIIHTTIETSDKYIETSVDKINHKERLTTSDKNLYSIDDKGNKKLLSERTINITTDRKGRAKQSVDADKNHKTGIITNIITRNKRKRIKTIIDRMYSVIREINKDGKETEYIDNDSFILESEGIEMKRYKNPTGSNLISINLDGDLDLNIIISDDSISGNINILNKDNKSVKTFNVTNNKFEERILEDGIITKVISKIDDEESHIDIKYDINSMGECKKIERVKHDTGEILSFSMYSQKDNSKTSTYYVREENI